VSIALEQLLKRYGAHTVVHNLDLEVGEGELLVLLGPSGSGKSTVFELADRLAVLHLGRLLEVGTPEELYLRPQTEFVATFPMDSSARGH
jgi:ABC-type sugar transport system ATPase subunit